MRHLTERQAVDALDRGRSVEQLLGADSTVVEWPVDPEEEHEEGTVLATFVSGAHALPGSVEHGAGTGGWVNDGMIQDEYADPTEA